MCVCVYAKNQSNKQIQLHKQIKIRLSSGFYVNFYRKPFRLVMEKLYPSVAGLNGLQQA
jgi:hypothetical protein